MKINGKGKFKLWAHKGHKRLDGKPFHSYEKNLKHLCSVLRENGWTINQIKRCAA